MFHEPTLAEENKKYCDFFLRITLTVYKQSLETIQTGELSRSTIEACMHTWTCYHCQPKKVSDKYNLTQSNNTADLDFHRGCITVRISFLQIRIIRWSVHTVKKIYLSYIHEKTSEQIIDVPLLLKISYSHGFWCPWLEYCLIYLYIHNIKTNKYSAKLVNIILKLWKIH